MSIRAVVFDLYGMLTEDLGRDGYDALLRQMAAVLLLSADGFSAAWCQVGSRLTTGGFATLEEGLTHICNVLGTQADAERIEAAVELRVGYIRANLRPRDDAVETLTRLKSLGLKIALISDCGLEVPMLWSETPFAPFVDTALFSSREGLCKPEAVLYLRACERLGVLPEECLYVGDGNGQELSGAKAVGMTAVLIAVPGAVHYDYGRLEAASWQGPRVAALSDLMNLVD